jgi:hypothetical protein
MEGFLNFWIPDNFDILPLGGKHLSQGFVSQVSLPGSSQTSVQIGFKPLTIGMKGEEVLCCRTRAHGVAA